jgi:nuclear pore complex protein Nup155
VIVRYADDTISNSLAIDDAEAVRKNAYQLALGSDDPVFHSELYDWLVKQGRTDDLLEVSALFVYSICSY